MFVTSRFSDLVLEPSSSVPKESLDRESFADSRNALCFVFVVQPHAQHFSTISAKLAQSTAIERTKCQLKSGSAHFSLTAIFDDFISDKSTLVGKLSTTQTYR